MADSIDDLERAVEELINTADLSARQHEVYAARARELVRRLRAGIAECERMREQRPPLAHMSYADRLVFGAIGTVLDKLTGATGEERE